jgi:hypothetical protein
MAYVTSGQVGIDLDATTAGTTTNGADAVYALGQSVTATDGSQWVYVQAGAAITQYSWLSIDENFQAVMGTTALAAAGHAVGFAQVGFADNEFGWVCVHAPGNIRVRALNSCAADVQLYTSGTAGVLDDTSAGVNLIRGCVLVVAASNTATGNREVIAVYPSGSATP